METDREYYARRAREERDAAENAASAQASALHLAIAESYSVRAERRQTRSLLAA